MVKNKLENKGYKVWAPNLPDSDHPILKDWLGTIFSNKDWEFNNDSIILGHSSGATLMLRILEKLKEDILI